MSREQELVSNPLVLVSILDRTGKINANTSHVVLGASLGTFRAPYLDRKSLNRQLGEFKGPKSLIFREFEGQKYLLWREF